MTKTFSIWRLVIGVGWAKTLTWATTTEKEQRIHWLAIQTVKKGDNAALEFILGPMSLIVGFV